RSSRAGSRRSPVASIEPQAGGAAMLPIDLKGRRAVVTGGSRGVGRATALLLARAGADVGISYRSRAAAAQETVADLERLGVSAWAEPGDLADAAAAERLIARA